LPVFAQARRFRDRCLRDHLHGEVRVVAGVEACDTHVAGTCARRRGGERSRDPRQGGCEEAPPHWNAPSKLFAPKAGRGASGLSSCPKKLGGRTTPFVDSFSRKWGFSPVAPSGESSRVRPALGLCSSSGGRASKMSWSVITSDSIRSTSV